MRNFLSKTSMNFIINLYILRIKQNKANFFTWVFLHSSALIHFKDFQLDVVHTWLFVSVLEWCCQPTCFWLYCNKIFNNAIYNIWYMLLQKLHGSSLDVFKDTLCFWSSYFPVRCECIEAVCFILKFIHLACIFHFVYCNGFLISICNIKITCNVWNLIKHANLLPLSFAYLELPVFALIPIPQVV